MESSGGATEAINPQMSKQQLHTRRPRRVGEAWWLAAVLMLITDSLHFIFARLLLSRLSPLLGSTYMIYSGMALVALYWIIWRRSGLGFLLEHWFFYLVTGALIAGSVVFSFMAVELIGPGLSSLLMKTGYLFSLALGFFWLRERVSRLQALGSLISIGGIFLIALQPFATTGVGMLLAIVSAAFYSAHGAVVKRFGQSINFEQFFVGRMVGTTIFMLIFSSLRAEYVLPSWDTALLLLIAGAVNVVLGRVLYYQVLRRVSLSVHTILLTMSPVLTIVWAVLFFGAFLSGQEVLGGALVLAGLILVGLRRPPPGRADPD